MMTSITQILEYKNHETVETLTDLLLKARKGDLRGIVFIYKSSAKRHRIGITGEYWEDPAQALGATVRMSYRLNQAVSEVERNGGGPSSTPPPPPQH